MSLELKFFGSKSELREKSIMFSLCALIFLPSINNFINSTMQQFLGIEIGILTPVVYIFMAFLSVFVLYRYTLSQKKFFVILFFFLISVIISYILYPEIRDIIYNSPVDLVYSPVNKLMFYCIPALGGITCLSDYNELFRKMRVWGLITIGIGSISYVLVSFIAGEVVQYMVFSYFMLVPICVCYEYARIEDSVLDLIFAIIGTVCILMCGARGTCIALILYFIVRGFGINIRKVRTKSVINFIMLIVSLTAVFLFYDDLLMLISSFLDSIGVDSRFITKLAEGVLLDDNGRNKLSIAIWKGLMDNPLGYGIFGDRYVTGAFGSGRYTYSHSIISELLCDFGLVLGLVLLIVIFWRILKTVFYSEDDRERGLLLSLLPYGLFQLFFSSSCFENIPFFIILGLCFFVRFEKIDNRQIGDKI